MMDIDLERMYTYDGYGLRIEGDGLTLRPTHDGYRLMMGGNA